MNIISLSPDEFIDLIKDAAPTYDPDYLTLEEKLFTDRHLIVDVLSADHRAKLYYKYKPYFHSKVYKGKYVVWLDGAIYSAPEFTASKIDEGNGQDTEQEQTSQILQPIEG